MTIFSSSDFLKPPFPLHVDTLHLYKSVSTQHKTIKRSNWQAYSSTIPICCMAFFHHWDVLVHVLSHIIHLCEKCVFTRDARKFQNERKWRLLKNVKHQHPTKHDSLFSWLYSRRRRSDLADGEKWSFQRVNNAPLNHTLRVTQVFPEGKLKLDSTPPAD